MKKNVGVIFGSRSCEREVSIISALQLMRYADPEKYEVIPVYIHDDGTWYSGNALRDLKTYQPFRGEQENCLKVFLDMSSGSGALLHVKQNNGLIRKTTIEIAARIDVFVIVMHGLNGEDGSLQGMLELANVPYTSTGIAGSAVGMDKIMMKQFFRGGGLPVLPGLSFSRKEYHDHAQSVIDVTGHELGYPVFVKPANLGSSIGVSRADNAAELADSLELAFEYDRRVLVEKGLNKPIELNCSVLGFDQELEASPIEMPVSADDFLNFKEKYLSSGGSKGMASLHRILPAPIEDTLKEKIQNLSKQIFRMLDCKGVVRIDYMFDAEQEALYITEINTIPGSLAFYLWENAGTSYASLIDKMIEYAFAAHEEKNAANYAFTSDILKSAVIGSKGSKGSKAGKMPFGK